MALWRANCAPQTSDSEEFLSFSENEENLVPPEKKKKRLVRKAQWQDSHVADWVDVKCSNDNFARKLIFMHQLQKHQKQ